MAGIDQIIETEDNFEYFGELFNRIRVTISTADSSIDGDDTDCREKLAEIETLVETLEDNQKILARKCPDYDFIGANGVRIKSNGHRSLLTILKHFLECYCSWIQSQCLKKTKFSSSNQLDVLKSLQRPLNSMNTNIMSAVQMMQNDSASGLIHWNYIDMLSVYLSEDMARDMFYGTWLGFQYSSGGMKSLLRSVAIGFACYDDWRASNDHFVKKIFSRLLKTATLNDDERGVMIANVTDGANIQMTKAYWSLPDKFQGFFKILNQFLISTAISTNLFVPDKRITIKNLKHKLITMDPPTSLNICYYPIRLLLISNKRREGQSPSTSNRYHKIFSTAPLSDNLVIHIHGGGFVATSPNSHESYLRVWSQKLDCPVVSIDYSLAPEAPYPRGLEECLFAYVWILNNLEALGTTGRRIILAGDSAGGNFVLAVSMKLKILQLRQPDHIFAFYPPTIVKLCATPSRLLAVFDIILPLGILISCLQAYIGEVPDEALIQRRREIRSDLYTAKGNVLCTPKHVKRRGSYKGIPNIVTCTSSHYIAQQTKELMDTYKDSDITNDPFVSPALATDEMLMGLAPTTILCGSLDPLLDDGIVFAKRLRSINQPVTLRVMEGLSHGFLMFSMFVEDFKEANDESIDLMKEALSAC